MLLLWEFRISIQHGTKRQEPMEEVSSLAGRETGELGDRWEAEENWEEGEIVE